jgi:hypothetical protein
MRHAAAEEVREIDERMGESQRRRERNKDRVSGRWGPPVRTDEKGGRIHPCFNIIYTLGRDKGRVLLVVNRPPFVVLPKIHQGAAKNTSHWFLI